MIYILEDNDERIAAFQNAASTIVPRMPVRVWRSAHQMMRDLVDCIEDASIISLDHDLVPVTPDAEDPGCGYDVVKFLAELTPCCPLIIHTSNADRATWMIGELSRTTWRYKRVYPFKDDWIATDWAAAVKLLLG